jgi:hypothetical protein
MSLTDVSFVALGTLLVALASLALCTRRFCQRCDYCGRFYWWIGWASFEWTSHDYMSWAMRCKACQWLTRQLQTTLAD